jgi:hypothetical protein
MLNTVNNNITSDHLKSWGMGYAEWKLSAFRIYMHETSSKDVLWGIPHHRDAQNEWACNLLVWPNCDVLHHQNMIYHLQSVLSTSKSNRIQPGVLSLGGSPRYYGQEHNLSNSLFSPYYYTIIGSNLTQSASMNLEQHPYMVRSSKTVKLWASKALMSRISFLGDGC